MEPKFNSDYDSFLLLLRNLNFNTPKISKNGDKKTAIKTGDKKVTARTQKQYDIILNFMEQGKEYGIQDFCNLLELKESRTNELLNGLLINENKIEIVGAKRDRRYRLI